MTSARRTSTRFAAAAVAVAGGVLAMAPATAQAAPALAPPSVPAEIAVPDGNHVTSRYDAIGFQVYECGTAGTWTLHAPKAWLSGNGDTAVHFGGVDANLPAGPYWQSNKDHSRVHGGGAVSTASRDGAVPLLRLSALDTSGTGVFADVTFVHRLNTIGGVAPAGTCDPANKAFKNVFYSATYFFYKAN
ncbi:DUF3455 domain-containing protein [Umezawaea sp. Da 62-37]|uniref:DUF3455 domain-containing protein n=1 Tax=Umezawaea sp. Da 62-37 TaxID=3075927 RepID=UPI0028F6C605|nr:DUF3455 domain-containing protein [Umezawaea sp. Da 62-37]WNV88512.1 DUF3455 domain-containing protein [Umezawaea sp. Da 62-37]